MKRIKFIAILIGFLWSNSCNIDKSNGTYLSINLAQVPYERLSDYGFFGGELKDLNPQNGVYPYELNSTLFTDYASKSRFIYLPEGTQMNYQGDFKALDFPVGSIIIKNFFFHTDARDTSLGRQLIETRLLVRKENGWKPYEYQWNIEQSDADRIITGATVSASTILDNGEKKEVLSYVLPRELDCRTCHNLNGEMTPIGPRPASLNRLGEFGNQLADWKKRGILSDIPSDIRKIPNYNNSELDPIIRGRAYLDANCAHCHKPGGTANANGLFVNWDYVGEEMNKGQRKIPTNYNAPNLQYDIVPGNPEESILWYRMTQNKAPDMMPQLGRSINHDEGIEIIKDYIASLKSTN